MKKEKAITLIALIITVILMLILAGVVLSLTIGENGLFKTAKYAVQKNSETEAKEKLELALADLQSRKYTDDDYNEKEYIDDYLENEDMEASGSIVIVDNWNFEIDRSIPSIKASLGVSTVKLTKEVKEYLGKNENDKYMVSVLVKIESDIKIESIDFENTDGTILTVTPEKETITKDMQIELDKEYKIRAKMADGKIETRIIIERSVENIRTVEELVAFRDKVNTGLTYEGKTVNLLADLDLSSVCGENVNGQEVSWEPIGNYGTDNTHIFKGIFDGHYNKINNIYIKTTKDYQGLFGYNYGTIKNIIINTGMVEGRTSTGSIVAGNNGTIDSCGNNINITSTQACAGGIVGTSNNGKIYNCYNIGNITAMGCVGGSESYSGGIVGTQDGGQIYNCYNTGKVKSSYYFAGGIVGCTTWKCSVPLYLNNCYNIGTITSSGYSGSIMGNVNQYITINNCYYTSINNYGNSGYGGNASTTNVAKVSEETLKTYAPVLGSAYTEDEKIKVIDETTGEEKEAWKYNNGYPILKWQLRTEGETK